MNSSDFRTEARNKLSGKWTKAALITVVYFAVFFVLSFIENAFSENLSGLFSLIQLIIEVPLSFGFVISLVKLYNSEEVSALDVITSGYHNFAKSWGITWNIVKEMILPVVLIIVSVFVIIGGFVASSVSFLGAGSDFNVTKLLASASGVAIVGIILYIVGCIWLIIKSYYYSLSYVIAAHDSSLTAKDAVEKSQELMQGKRWKLFVLQLSFIGWAILGTITMGIGFIFIMPYIQFATIAFYNYISGNQSNVNSEPSDVEPITNNDDTSSSL